MWGCAVMLGETKYNKRHFSFPTAKTVGHKKISSQFYFFLRYSTFLFFFRIRDTQIQQDKECAVFFFRQTLCSCCHYNLLLTMSILLLLAPFVHRMRVTSTLYLCFHHIFLLSHVNFIAFDIFCTHMAS